LIIAALLNPIPHKHLRNEAVQKWVLGLGSSISAASKVKEPKKCQNEQFEKFSNIQTHKEGAPPTSKVSFGVEE